jgi:hypothetical protein
MSTPKRLSTYERRLHRFGATIKDALRLAALPESTYYRWKNGTRSHIRPRTWERFERAVDMLAPPGAKPPPKPKPPPPKPKPPPKPRKPWTPKKPVIRVTP